jgi:shikimate kinase
MKIFIIGPGGVGKSSSGKILAKLLGYKFIDLDLEFCDQIQNVGEYIKTIGYEKYCFENSELFNKILSEESDNFVFSLSSGFLVHEDSNELTTKHKQTLKENGVSILLLPSKSLEESTEVIIPRQLSRGFGLKEDSERKKFTHRYPLYKQMGDIKIFSIDNPESIAKQMKEKIDAYKRD